MLEWTPDDLTEEGLWERWLESEAVRAFESGRIGPDQFAKQTIDEFELTVSEEQFLDAFVTWVDGLFDGVEDLLARLRPNVGLATMSNTNEIHWPKLIESMGLGRLIPDHFPSHRTGLLKPDADAFLNVIDRLGVQASQILFFDDNQLNVRAERKTGMQAARVSGPYEVESHILELSPRLLDTKD